MKRAAQLFYLINGVIALIFGALITFAELSFPNPALIVIGIWASMIGLYQIVIAVRMKKKVRHHGLFS